MVICIFGAQLISVEAGIMISVLASWCLSVTLPSAIKMSQKWHEIKFGFTSPCIEMIA